MFRQTIVAADVNELFRETIERILFECLSTVDLTRRLINRLLFDVICVVQKKR